MADELKIAFLGAGNANFGGGEGPWDHASRLEKIEGISIVGIADLNTKLAERRLAARRNGKKPQIYANTRIFADYREMLDETHPDAIFIGLPPEAHGTIDYPKDIELTCAKAGVHMFIEKPLSCAPPEEVAKLADALRELADQKNLIISIGYMFRYSRAVSKMKEIIAETPSGVRVVIARYNCAYSEIASKVWWDIRRTAGPIVEQATHFCDLTRYLAGEPDLSTIFATEIKADEPAGQLCDMPVDEEGKIIDADIPIEFRIPRATAAIWRFANGAIGSLNHGVLLHRKKYLAELEVWCDGVRILLDDPYGKCHLHIRRSHSDETETLDFSDDDPYLTEDKVFIDAIRTGDSSSIRCNYDDAFRTYQLTWAIRRAAEKHSKTS